MEDLIRAFGALRPVPDLGNSPLDQATLVDGILLSPHFNKYPPSQSYQLSFWKKIIERLESHDEVEVDDRIYARYLDLLASRSSALLSGPPAASYCTYSLSDSDSPHQTTITLLEARTTIEAGTTGLRTWKAAFSFAEWLLRHPEIIHGKSVLELGSGAGFLGILVGKLQAGSQAGGRVCMTDYNYEVLERCRHNVHLECNQLTTSESIAIQNFNWFDCLEDSPQRPQARSQLTNIAADVIVGTDLVYDVSIVPALTATLSLAFEVSAFNGAYIALAVRRDTTFAAFEDGLKTAGLAFEVIPLDLGNSSLPDHALHTAEGVRLLHITLVRSI